MRLILFLAAAVVASGVVAAQNPNLTPNAKADPSQKIVCKTERLVGSMIEKRICRTQDEWDAIESGAKQSVEDRQHFGLNPPPRGGGG